MASGFLKCGYLKIKRPPTSGKVRIKAWQSKYFVLRDTPPRFEYFKDELSFNNSRHSKEKNKINLENVIHIGTTDASKTQRNAFMIVDAEHGAIMLATDSEKETKEWVDALNKVSGKSGSPGDCTSIGEFMYPDTDQSTVSHPRHSTSSAEEPPETPVSLNENTQAFPVTTRLTPSSEKLGIRDDYTMHITYEYVAIHDIDNTLVVQWPIVGLRGWKSEPADVACRRGTQLLTLEAGRKSATGEGLFQFFSGFGNQIANQIRLRSNYLCDLAVEKREKFKEISNSSEDLSSDTNSTMQITKPIVRSSTDPRPVTSFVLPKPSISTRSESDSNISNQSLERRTSSPSSLRKELLQEKLSKDINKTKQNVPEEPTSPNPSSDNTYLDLISDDNATPVHIADSEHHRKSLDSLSLNSDEGIIMQKTLLNRVNEINSPQNYIGDREIDVYRQKSLKKKKSLEERNGIYSDPTKLKTIDSQTQKTSQNTSSNALCQDFLEQLSNPQTHQANIFQEKTNIASQEKSIEDSKNESIKTASVLAEKSDQSSIEEDKEPCQNNNIECSSNQSECIDESEKLASDLDHSQSAESEFISMRKPRSMSHNENRVFPHGKEETMDLLEKLVCNLESPQTCAQERIFPPLTKRNGLEKVEKTTNDTTGSLRHTKIKPKKTINKSKSHTGFDTKQKIEKPPPLPMRPEIASHARTKPSASLGDISKDLPRPLDFHKDGTHRQLSPWTSNTPALGAPWGPDSVVHARLLHRSTSGSSLGAVREAQQLAQQEIEKNALENTSPSLSQESDRITDDEFDGKKRRGSNKASTFISRVLNTLNPADSKRRGSCDAVTNGGAKEFDPSKRGRSCSVIPGGIINEGWSPEQSLDVPSPEGSPMTSRRGRRQSHDPNLDRNRKIFIGSPTSKEEMRQREKARERERERSELPSEPPPQLPPRKKSDPPPLPPRLRNSSSDSSSDLTPPMCKLQTQSTSNDDEDETAPPPIPPRRLDDRRGSQPAPAIHLTTSSPEDRPLDSTLGAFPGVETADSSTAGVSRTKQPNNHSTRPPEDSSVSCPIPQRPKATHDEMTSHNASQQMDEETKESCDQVSKRQNNDENSFVSIEMQERGETGSRQRTPEERLELRDIERDSMDSSPHPGNASPKSSHGALSQQASSGSTERYSPGHTPPMGLNLPPRNGGIVLGDSPTTPISV